MPKGYWIVNNAVHDVETYEKYKLANAEAFAKFDAKFVIRGGQQQLREGQSHPRTVVLEFPSYDVAVACYESDEYQKAMAIRTPISDGNLVIVEGYDG
jgi:uncharacterized protein (DUF1330 family)